ncbi:MAG: hypothetical protein R3D26_15350 [Cyanobacteriota/Melainabacteria group bacterium]
MGDYGISVQGDEQIVETHPGYAFEEHGDDRYYSASTILSVSISIAPCAGYQGRTRVVVNAVTRNASEPSDDFARLK